MMTAFRKPQEKCTTYLRTHQHRIERHTELTGKEYRGENDDVYYHYKVEYWLISNSDDLGSWFTTRTEAKRELINREAEHLEHCSDELKYMVVSFYDTGDEYYDASNLVSEVAAFLSTKRITLKEFFDYCDTEMSVEKNFKKNYIYTSLWSQAKIKIQNAREILKHTIYD